MKSFKDFVLTEDINNWALSRLGKKFKNGNIDWRGLASKPKDIEELKELYKQEHPNYKEEDLEALSIEKIKKLAGDANNLKKNKGKQTFLGKYKEDADKAISAIKRLLTKAKNENLKDVEDACNNVLNAASVVTEDDEVDGNNALDTDTTEEKSPEAKAIEEKLKELDAVVAKHGIDINEMFIGASEIEQGDIADQIIAFLKKLGADKNVIIGGSNTVLKDLLNNADTNKDRVFSPEEIREFVSAKDKANLTGSGKVDETVARVLPFVLFILWVNTTAPDVLQKVSEKTHGRAQGEGVSENFNSIIKAVSEKRLKLDKKAEPFKALGDRFINDMLSEDKYKELVVKLNKIAAEMKKPIEKSASPIKNGANHPVSPQPQETQDKSKTDTSSDDQTETSETSPETSPDGANTEDEEEARNSTKDLITSLTRDSKKEEVNAAIEKVFGTATDANEDGDANRGTVFANLVDAIEKAKKNNQSLYDVSHAKKNEESEEKPEVQTEDFFFDCADNKLINETLIGRKVGAALGRVNISNNERNTNSWNKCLIDLRKKQVATLNKAKTIMAKMFDNINSVSKKGNLLVDLKKLDSNYKSSMTAIFIDYRKANSYNGIGAMAHDARVAGLKGAKKAKEAEENSKFGQESKIINQNIENKIESINAQSLDKYIQEDLRDVFAYAALNQSNPTVLQEPDVDSDTGKMTVIKSALNAVANNNEVFGVGNERELMVFLGKLLEKSKEDQEIGRWLANYKGVYDKKKLMKPIRNVIFDLNKVSGSISDKLSNSPDPYADICSALGLTQENLHECVKSFKEYYLLTEQLFKRNPKPQQSATFTDEEKKSLATLCLLAAVGKPNDQKLSALKTPAASIVLSKIGRDEAISQHLTIDDIIKSAQKFVEENSDKVNKAAQGLMTLINKEPQQQPTVPPATQPTTQPTPAAGQNGQTNVNDISAQNDDSETGGTDYHYADGESVVTTPQATVTTGAVGGYTIPDRLTKQLIRRRIKSFV
jgi:hypothetical protein